jgi:hypothetical protein
MRIDAVSLLLASQIQPQRPPSVPAMPTGTAAPSTLAGKSAKTLESGQFQPLVLKSTAEPPAKPNSLEPLPRPGAQLDIKV